MFLSRYVHFTGMSVVSGAGGVMLRILSWHDYVTPPSLKCETPLYFMGVGPPSHPSHTQFESKPHM